MVSDQELRLYLTDLVISEHETGGRAVLPHGSRARLQEFLARILVNRNFLRAHTQFLDNSLSRRAYPTEPLPESIKQAVISQGLKALDDGTFTRLILNPTALRHLYEMIDERMPEAWLDVMEQDGRALLEAHGRSIPAFEPPAQRRDDSHPEDAIGDREESPPGP